MDILINSVVTVLVALFASAGFWSFLSSAKRKKPAETRILMGLAHAIIIDDGTKYLERGDWITEAEYEGLVCYLGEPYLELNGNGSAKKTLNDVKEHLRIVPNSYARR